ncbi:MAG: hypothetical protein ACYTGC_17610 [Planctomycetota bacterium]|jgi:hypothetical protein
MSLTLICVLLAAMAPLPRPSIPRADPPVAVFAELDGTWEGTFVGFDSAGRELYRIRVRQIYRTVSDTVQRVRIEDRMNDGTVVTGEGENIATRRADGTLELRCIVRKSTGERVEHQGRLVSGPDGDRQIVWHSEAPGRTETFRETVRPEGARHVYEINGLGRYGETLMLMTGRYVRVETPASPHQQEPASP